MIFTQSILLPKILKQLLSGYSSSNSSLDYHIITSLQKATARYNAFIRKLNIALRVTLDLSHSIKIPRVIVGGDTLTQNILYY